MNLDNIPDWAFGPFNRPKDKNPVIRPDNNSIFQCPMQKTPVKWEALHVFNPAATVFNSKIYLIYRAEDDTGEMKIGRHTSRLGLAESTDGINFTKYPTPILYPDEDNQKRYEWIGGCEDPRIVEGEDGQFILTYTMKGNLLSRLGIAISKDLVHWEKLGLAFYKKGRPWISLDTKAASIVCSVVDGRLKATKINGKYWMYWGVRGINIANSYDLIHWETHGMVVKRRRGFFDVLIAEAGCPAVMTEHGIVLIYNAKNHEKKGDPSLSHKLYTGGQLLFDKQDLFKCIGRLDRPFYKPELPCEITGQYMAGTTFLEGLALFHDKWFMYYGCSDSVVGVAVWDPAGKK